MVSHSRSLLNSSVSIWVNHFLVLMNSAAITIQLQVPLWMLVLVYTYLGSGGAGLHKPVFNCAKTAKPLSQEWLCTSHSCGHVGFSLSTPSPALTVISRMIAALKMWHWTSLSCAGLLDKCLFRSLVHSLIRLSFIYWVVRVLCLVWISYYQIRLVNMPILWVVFITQ